MAFTIKDKFYRVNYRRYHFRIALGGLQALPQFLAVRESGFVNFSFMGTRDHVVFSI